MTFHLLTSLYKPTKARIKINYDNESFHERLPYTLSKFVT